MKQLKKNLIYLTIIFLIFIFFIGSILALTANNSNYSISMFGTGMATGTPSSPNYNSTFLSETGGTTRNAESTTYTGNIGFFGNTTYYRTVSITSYSISPTSTVVGSTIGLSISALNYQSIWAKIIAPNSIQQIVFLINGTTVNYLPSPSIVGRYNVTFYANSSIGAITSIIDYFELTTAAIPPPSGGRDGRSCTYIWDCGSWSICANENRTRECENTGTCTGIEGKPVEQRICSDALFDVSIKFTDLIITGNNTLKFDINLIEKEGIEKIDVQVRYSIIDEDDNEIFSQIETKAIQGELTYKKEIEEVKLVDGEYILRVDILYGNLQRAFAEQKFEVKKGVLESIPPEGIINKLLIIFGTLIFLAILITLIKLIRNRRKEINVLIKKGKKDIKEGKLRHSKEKYKLLKRLYESKYEGEISVYEKIKNYYHYILVNSIKKNSKKNI